MLRCCRRRCGTETMTCPGMRWRRRTGRFLVTVCLALAVAACGGEGGNDAPAPSPPQKPPRQCRRRQLVRSPGPPRQAAAIPLAAHRWRPKPSTFSGGGGPTCGASLAPSMKPNTVLRRGRWWPRRDGWGVPYPQAQSRSSTVDRGTETTTVWAGFTPPQHAKRAFESGCRSVMAKPSSRLACRRPCLRMAPIGLVDFLLDELLNRRRDPLEMGFIEGIPKTMVCAKRTR